MAGKTRQNPIARRTLLGATVFSSLLPLLSSGCILFPNGDPTDVSKLLPETTGASYTVMLKGSKPETKELRQNMLVEHALIESGALKKFGKMDIVVKRVIQGKQGRHRLDVDFDSATRKVKEEQNYAIHPNDIVIISPDNSTQLDKVIDSLSGVLGRNN